MKIHLVNDPKDLTRVVKAFDGHVDGKKSVFVNVDWNETVRCVQ
jgi:hypothetical protein